MPDNTSGMDADIFEAFSAQLERYVRERLLPAEKIPAPASANVVLLSMAAFVRFSVAPPRSAMPPRSGLLGFARVTVRLLIFTTTEKFALMLKIATPGRF